MFIDVFTWDIKGLINKVKLSSRIWLHFIFLILLFAITGYVASYVTNTPRELSKTASRVILIIGSVGNLFIQIIFTFVVLKVFQLFLKLNITNKQMVYIGLIGSIPILISSIFNITCIFLFGYSSRVYTSLAFFFDVKNQFLKNFLLAMNPFVLWQLVIVSMLMVYITSKNKNWMIGLYILVFLFLKILVG